MVPNYPRYFQKKIMQKQRNNWSTVNNQRPDQRQLRFTMALNTSEIFQTEHLWQEVDNISGIKGSQFGFI
jgi:hypothetical protein